MKSNERNRTARIVSRREGLGAAAGLGAMAATTTRMSEAADDQPGTVLITGSNRGIGWQFASHVICHQTLQEFACAFPLFQG